MSTPVELRVVVSLGVAQTLAWASSFYLPAMLAVSMGRDVGLATPTVFLAFSVALVVSAAVGPWAGRAIDHHGGRPVLVATSGLFALGLAALGLAQGPYSLFAAWVLLGIAMGSGLYEAAFATLVRLHGHGSRNAITGVTLMAGLASTVGWPLSAWLESRIGWRGACFAWAGLHLLVGLPLNAAVPSLSGKVPGSEPQSAANPAPSALAAGNAPKEARTTALLAFVFAATWFITTAIAAHLPQMLQGAGASLQTAVMVGALVGPAQVGGRLLEFGFLRRVNPLTTARIAALGHPVGVAMLLLAGAPLAAAFAVLHGAGNGILTIAKGTLPLVLFGPAGYGARQGWLTLPGRMTQASAPFLFGLALDHLQARALWITAGLGLAAFAALMLLSARSGEVASPQ